jgi:hypothetical protein
MNAVGDEKPRFRAASWNLLVRRLRESDRSLGHLEEPLTYKAMAEVIWDEDNRKIDGASQPYVPLPGFWLFGWGLCCRWLLQSVAKSKNLQIRRPDVFPPLP